MFFDSHIPTPYLFNPLKHHLGFIRTYINTYAGSALQDKKSLITRELKHLGTSLMDIYSGRLSLEEIYGEVDLYLKTNNLYKCDNFCRWTGKLPRDFKTLVLSDGSVWIVKYFNNKQRYIHYFPARNGSHSVRAKANTVKSAILYLVFIDKDFISEEDLNRARSVTGLSPVKGVDDAEAISEMIEIIRA